MAIDYTTPLGQLRLLISDVNSPNGLILDDQQVEGFLALWGIDLDATTAPRGTVKRAAADALDAIATSEALVSKAIRTQDLTTDGPKTAAALRAHATVLRAQAAGEDAASDDGGFFVAEFAPWAS